MYVPSGSDPRSLSFNVALSDAPPHRVGWSSPTVDPETGNVYALGVDATFFGLSPDGELLWERFLMEEFGAISTHGGRTPSPVVVDDLVIVSAVTSGWVERIRCSQWVPLRRAPTTRMSASSSAELASRSLMTSGSPGAG